MRDRVRRYLFLAAGLLFVALGGLGVVVPGLPTTPFLLLAAGCFAQSSPRLHAWLLANPTFGPLIRDWQRHRAIPRRARRMGLLMIVVVGLFSLYLAPTNTLRWLIAALLVIPVVILIRLKTVEELPD